MCKKCEKETVFTLINGRKLCRSCFIRYIDDKILFTIRKYKLLRKYEPVYIEKGKYSEILKQFFKKNPLYPITKTKSSKTRILLSDSTDSIAVSILTNQLINKPKLSELVPKNKNYVKPLYHLLDKELELYAKLKHIKLNKQKKQDSITEKTRQFLNEMEKKHPEIKYSTLKSIEQVRQI